MRPLDTLGSMKACRRASWLRSLLLAMLLMVQGLTTMPITLLAAQTVSPLQPSVPISGSSFGLPAGAVVRGALPATYPLHLVVGLTLSRQTLLDTFLQERNRPGSPLYRQTVTPAQFSALFGPDVSAQGHVIGYLQTHGLHIVRTYPTHLLLDVAGDEAQVDAAFGVSLMRYRDRRGALHYANMAAPRLPADLAPLVTSVVGLRDDMAIQRVPLHLGSRRASGGLRPHIDGPVGLTPAQLQRAYDITPIYSQVFTNTAGVTSTVPITGAGQTVAMYELSPISPADIAAYDAAFGLTATLPISTVAVDGGANDAFGALGRLEAAMDIELTQAVAPGARIIVYQSYADPASNDLTAADDAYARIVNDDTAQVLATSWGQCEPDQLQSTDTRGAVKSPDSALLHALFAQAVAEGMTVVAASGDLGVNDCSDGQPNPSVDFPGSDPNVISVGGTALQVDASGQRIAETGWANSGGGASAVFSRPTWQIGPGLTGTISPTMRQVPDVASSAASNYAVYVDGGWRGGGGTSSGVPVWSALLALVNQARMTNALLRTTVPAGSCLVPAGLGNILPDLYRLDGSSAFYDVVSGSSNGAGAPGPGWDYVTGLGSPDASQLLLHLLAMPDLVPQVVSCASAAPRTSATPIAAATSATATVVGAASTVTPTATSTLTTIATATVTATATTTLSAGLEPPPTTTAIATPVPTRQGTPTATAHPGTATASVATNCYFSLGARQLVLQHGTLQALLLTAAQAGAHITVTLTTAVYPARVALFNNVNASYSVLTGRRAGSSYTYLLTVDRHSGVAVLVFPVPGDAASSTVMVRAAATIACSHSGPVQRQIVYRVIGLRPPHGAGHAAKQDVPLDSLHLLPQGYTLSPSTVRTAHGTAALSIRSAGRGRNTRPILVVRY